MGRPGTHPQMQVVFDRAQCVVHLVALFRILDVIHGADVDQKVEGVFGRNAEEAHHILQQFARNLNREIAAEIDKPDSLRAPLLLEPFAYLLKQARVIAIARFAAHRR